MRLDVNFETKIFLVRQASSKEIHISSAANMKLDLFFNLVKFLSGINAVLALFSGVLQNKEKFSNKILIK